MANEIHHHAEAHGLYLLSFFESAGTVSPVFERKARSLFADHGLDDIQQEEYYPTNKSVDAFQAVVDEIGEDTMRQGGKQMGQDIPFPDDVTTPHDALAMMDALHQEANQPLPDAPDWVERPGGGYTHERVDTTTARAGVTENFAYPASLGKGATIGAAERFTDARRISTEDVDPEGDEKAAWKLEW